MYYEDAYYIDTHYTIKIDTLFSFLLYIKSNTISKCLELMETNHKDTRKINVSYYKNKIFCSIF